MPKLNSFSRFKGTLFTERMVAEYKHKFGGDVRIMFDMDGKGVYDITMVDDYGQDLPIPEENMNHMLKLAERLDKELPL